MTNPLTTNQKTLLATAIGVTVTFGLLYIAFRVAGSGWKAGETSGV